MTREAAIALIGFIALIGLVYLAVISDHGGQA